MKKILVLFSLVLISLVACSNGSTSHNDEPVYVPATTNDIGAPATVDDSEYYKDWDYYVCDYWLLVENSTDQHGEVYYHYVATESNPTRGGINYDVVFYDKNQNLTQTAPMKSSFNLDEGWLGGNPDEAGHIGVKIHKVNKDWVDENGNMVLRYLKTERLDLRDPNSWID